MGLFYLKNKSVSSRFVYVNPGGTPTPTPPVLLNGVKNCSHRTEFKTWRPDPGNAPCLWEELPTRGLRLNNV